MPTTATPPITDERALARAAVESTAMRAPLARFRLSDDSAGAGDGDAVRRITGVAYTGVAVDRWTGWQCVDLDGGEAPTRTGLLWEHGFDRSGFASDHQSILGHTSWSIEDGVSEGGDGRGIVIDGVFMGNGNALAERTWTNARNGYPYELSICPQPLTTEEIEAGATVVVNGRTLTGPGVVFRRWRMREVSVCIHGADADTRAEALRRVAGAARALPAPQPTTTNHKEHAMADETTQDNTKAPAQAIETEGKTPEEIAEAIKSAHPEVYEIIATPADDAEGAGDAEDEDGGETQADGVDPEVEADGPAMSAATVSELRAAGLDAEFCVHALETKMTIAQAKATAQHFAARDAAGRERQLADGAEGDLGAAPNGDASGPLAAMSDAAKAVMRREAERYGTTPDKL